MKQEERLVNKGPQNRSLFPDLWNERSVKNNKGQLTKNENEKLLTENKGSLDP